LKEAREEL